MISAKAIKIFQNSIDNYHIKDSVNQKINNPYKEGDLSHLLYHKNWIDVIQWHYEDIIRDPAIRDSEGMSIKRKIDASNQVRTNIVEKIDDFFLEKYKNVNPKKNARINSESPAWAIDRLSILEIKIFHMREETEREAEIIHKKNCQEKLKVLLTQRLDLSNSIDDLLEDIASGTKIMKVYRQMKMYNDDSLNPILYHRKKQ